MMRFRDEVYKLATPLKDPKIETQNIPPLDAETAHFKVGRYTHNSRFSRFSCQLEKSNLNVLSHPQFKMYILENDLIEWCAIPRRSAWNRPCHIQKVK
ncbi:MAG: hypothetical protein QXO71_06035 [Candidatus Jordarchaeaceae archaeon]